MCSTPFRVLLGIINTIFGIIGFVLTIVGALIAWCKPLLERLLSIAIQKLNEQYGEQSRGIDLNQIEEIILKVTNKVGLVLFIFGLIIFIISLLGCIGACCNVKCIMIVYIVLVLIIIIAHIAILIFYFTHKDLPYRILEKGMTNVMDQYKSLVSRSPESILGGLIMTTFNCCGVYNGTDFDNSTEFTHSDEVNGQRFDNIQYPITCCKPDQKINQYTFVLSDLNKICPRSFTDKNSNIQQGCLDPVANFLLKYNDLIAYCSIGILLFNVLVVILAILSIVL